ncbi:MAG TPA: SbmA/BacA-like family transporter [Myxococcota bacterium]|nr:SbmA/BacA-like family transporter [Myxococcota bacterium]
MPDPRTSDPKPGDQPGPKPGGAQPGPRSIHFDRLTWKRFTIAISRFTTSDVGGLAKWMIVGLVVFLLAINGLNVVNSYVGRDFITAITQRDRAGFVHYALLYVAVFAASTFVAVIHRFVEERLGLLWRSWLTDRLLHSYLDHFTYYRLSDQLRANGEIDNPDQRISEDVRSFTATTLSFVLLILNGTLTAIAFSGVLWAISRTLFLVAIAYAGIGSFLTVVFGYRLVGRNYAQLDREADFRADLVHARANAEALALSQNEPGVLRRLERHLDALVSNFRRITSVNRNLGFFTTGYNYLIQIIPALIVGPLYMRGDVEFGVVTQSAMAFSQLLGAFSLIVTQFQSISSFTAVIARLGSLGEAIEQSEETSSLTHEHCEHGEVLVDCPVCLARRVGDAQRPGVTTREEDGRLEYQDLTLRTPQEDRLLLKELSVAIPPKTRVRIIGPNNPAKLALFRATAGLWETGSGRIVRPLPYRILFLPERPYLPPGTLHEILREPHPGAEIPDEQIEKLADALDLDGVIDRVGLDAEVDWASALSLGEQQLVAVARLVLAEPQFAFLERPHTTLTPDQVAAMLDLLNEHAITYVTIDDRELETDRYDAVLELGAGGAWEWRPARGEKKA